MSACHIVNFYLERVELSRALADLAATALSRGEYVQALIDREQWSHFRSMSGNTDVPVDAALESSQLEFVPVTEVQRQLNVGGPPSERRFDSVIGEALEERLENWSGVHLFTQLVEKFLETGAFGTAERVERLAGDRCREQLQLTCCIDLSLLGAAEECNPFQKLVNLHHDVRPAGQPLDPETIAEYQYRTVSLAQKVQRHLQREQQLDAAVDYQKALNRRKDEFLAVLAHELRNPLGAISHAVDAMKIRGDQTAERERGIIERQVSQMTRLIDDLLDVSRVTRGEIELDTQRLALDDVIGRAVETARPLLAKSNHQLHLSGPQTPAVVQGDADRLTQVFTNLLTNAAQYTDPGGNIWVELEADATAVTVRVRDDGRGMDEATLEEAFQIFYRADDSPESADGLGLGLPLARQIVELHDGSIDASSDGPGRGSEVVVTLPHAAAPDETPPAESSRPEGQSASTQSQPDRTSRTTRILVVDDNRDLADTLVDILEHLGHEVRVAYDARSALDVVDSFQPRLAFLDLNLPEISGFELAERLRSRPASRRPDTLVALSGYGDAHTRQQSERAGFDTYLVKPVTPQRLQTVIDELLEAD